jgi:putative colanic acid biosynthesis UDP-glucose lipid carrier transferase
MIRFRSEFFFILLIVIELVLLNGFFFKGTYPHFFSQFKDYLKVHIKSVVVMNLAYVVIIYLLKIYDFRKNSTYQDILLTLLKQTVILGLFLFAIAGVRENRLLSNKSLVIVIIEIFLSFLLLRLFYLYIIRQLRREGFNLQKVILLGENDIKNNFVKTITNDKSFGLEIVKQISFDDKKKFDPIQLYQIIKNQNIRQVYFFLDDFYKENFVQKLSRFCENNLLILNIIPQTNSFLNSDLETDYIDRFRVLSYKELPFENTFVNVIKRSFDIIFSLFMTLFILSWLVPIMGLLIKLTSKGPVFFLQERVGFEGTPFKIIKFRTMKIDAEKYGPQLAKDKDPRVTSIGKILRKYRIDELPQFFNVLKGEMSIVGPRPERKFYINQIIEVNPRYKRLHNLKPGITSLGQVYYGYAENVKEMSERLNYDLLYLNNYNFFMDVKIIVLTVWVMIRGKGK